MNASGSTQDALLIEPLPVPPDAAVRVPGSKSITNRALICAALAPGTSTVTGALVADDTTAMVESVRGLGATVARDDADDAFRITGADLSSTHAAHVDARQSGTTSRFVLPVAAVRVGPTTVDGSAQLRRRPFGPQVDALRQLGARLEELDAPGRLPVRVTAPARGGRARIPGTESSQFISGLLIAGPLMPEGLAVELTTAGLVSRPYLDLTREVMRAFGATVEDLAAPPGRYVPTRYAVEPDASSASYFFAAAAITGGRVTVEGLGRGSSQGDLRFVDVLERMGATVVREATRTTVVGPVDGLRGVDVDLRDLSDTAQTLAAVAVFADRPTRVRGIGFIRGKETDRIHAVVTELRRAGLDAREHDDGFTVTPGTPQPTVFETYEDHRMAMSLSLLGLRHPGIALADPGCVGKTYPGFFADLDRLRTVG
ncbi:3-phosphoshikimate 1-carboxyvinyltransferase [Nostocoides japonicum T1-X7]|uniref:3-phosphoshikimate 1-carboxyvinyltransferase n=1 Tax=Nostocoides japonicum T1-X7 TaxID=1194083 RepID=A0A077LTM2_9MICO|nr:3-phosphoshikimate 1-carboxyvinyltransferase [Tetrasphaera japonica]CCH76953.1 3-phosphoshikimate 1-carboxyvinyltransferase [Tetrasphaera japonica T1-X7]